MLTSASPEYSILLLGLDNAGKTTLLSAIKALSSDSPSAQPVQKTLPTVGQNVAMVEFPDMYLRIWDIGGQHTLRNMWQSYYSSCHAIVFVIDSADVGDGELEDLNESSEFLSSVSSNGAGKERNGDPVVGADVRNSDGAGKGQAPASSRGGRVGRLAECKLALETVLAAEDAHGVPVLVLANKQDREDCVETVKIKEGLVRRVFEGEKGGGIRDSRVLPVSALRGAGVPEAVEWLRSRVRWNKEGRPPAWR
jgi:ADP-ribosylation factor related protein 1